jgi:hypothetical protein
MSVAKIVNSLDEWQSIGNTRVSEKGREGERRLRSILVKGEEKMKTKLYTVQIANGPRIQVEAVDRLHAIMRARLSHLVQFTDNSPVAPKRARCGVIRVAA